MLFKLCVLFFGAFTVWALVRGEVSTALVGLVLTLVIGAATWHDGRR